MMWFVDDKVDLSDMDQLEVCETLSGLTEYDLQLWPFPKDAPSSWTGIDTILESLDNSSMAMLDDAWLLISNRRIGFVGANITVISMIMANIYVSSEIRSDRYAGASAGYSGPRACLSGLNSRSCPCIHV